MPGLYVHFPFCASKCIYCDFYARVRKDWRPYVEALLQEIRERASALSVPPTTLYFGGGRLLYCRPGSSPGSPKPAAKPSG